MGVKEIAATTLALSMTFSCGPKAEPTPPPRPNPWESHLALMDSPEKGCAGRYVVSIDRGSLSEGVRDNKTLNKFPNIILDVGISPRTGSSVYVVTQIIDPKQVRSGFAFSIDTDFSQPHELKTEWSNCTFADALWDGQRLDMEKIALPTVPPDPSTRP